MHNSHITVGLSVDWLLVRLVRRRSKFPNRAGSCTFILLSEHLAIPEPLDWKISPGCLLSWRALSSWQPRYTVSRSEDCLMHNYINSHFDYMQALSVESKNTCLPCNELETKNYETGLILASCCCSHESNVVDGLWKGLVRPFSPMLLGKFYVHIYMAHRFIENYSLLPHPGH